MISLYICAGCRRRLRHVRAEKLFQWRPQATFISLARDTAPTRRDNLAKGNTPTKVERLNTTKEKQPIIQRKAKKQLPRPPGHANAGDLLEMLFDETLKEPPVTLNAPDQAYDPLEPYKNAEALKKMLEDSNCSAADAWQFFLNTFGADSETTGSSAAKLLPSYLVERSRALMKRLIDAKIKDPISSTLPSVTEISSVYTRLGILYGGDWVQLMVNLLARICGSDVPDNSASKSKAGLVSDLIGSWNVVCRKRGSFDGHSTEDLPHHDWSQLPFVSKKIVVEAYRKNGVSGCFNILTPSFHPRCLSSLPVVAFGSFSVLTKATLTYGETSDKAAPLISVLGAIVRLCGLGQSELYGLPQDAAANSVARVVKDDWRRLNERAAELDARKGFSSPSYYSLSRMSNALCHESLREAYAQRDARQVEKLWANAANLPAEKERVLSSKGEDDLRASTFTNGVLTAELCNYFILVYMGLRQSNRAIDVWNHMVEKGMPPNLITWTHMLMGCKAARDGKALEDVWSKMVNSGMVPDIHCWTTLVSGLMDCGLVDPAVRALENMGHRWSMEAQRKAKGADTKVVQKLGDIDGTIKPTIEIVNAALTGLLRKRKSALAYRILGWAGTLGILPDATTYNTLLRPLIRNGQTQEAKTLLRQMQEAGISADVATFTTILDETFRDSDRHTPTEQKTIINDLFSEMKAAGVQANLHTYGKVIDQLLRSSSRDFTAVNMVLKRISDENLNPSAHIYTSLVQHYFEQIPPQLDAVRGIIDRATPQAGGTDHIFWDRVIEGYARIGDTAAAMRFHVKAYRGGDKTSWITMRTLMTALIANEEWDTARSLVRAVRLETGGPLPEHQTGKAGQHRFWWSAKELGLLDADTQQ